jgi:hypothetical protein
VLGIELGYILMNHLDSPFCNSNISLVLLQLNSSLRGPKATLLCWKKQPQHDQCFQSLSQEWTRDSGWNISLIAASTIMWSCVMSDEYRRQITCSITWTEKLVHFLLSNQAFHVEGNCGWLCWHMPSIEIASAMIYTAQFIGLDVQQIILAHSSLNADEPVSVIGISIVALACSTSFTNQQLKQPNLVDGLGLWLIKIFRLVTKILSPKELMVNQQFHLQPHDLLIQYQTQFRCWYNTEYCQESLEQLTLSPSNTINRLQHAQAIIRVLPHII